MIAAPVAARQNVQSPGATFSSSADLVVLHVTVVDRKDGFVAGLPREAFTVYENGQPQRVTFFSNEDSPVTVGLVIDAIAGAVSIPGHPLDLDAGFSISGWLAVLLTFLLARVFAEGTRMRDDLEGTV